MLSDAANAAVGCEKKTQVPAELTLAQWAVESGWGLHSPGNNPFGIKASTLSDPSSRQLLETHEWLTNEEREQFLSRMPGRTAELVVPVRNNGSRSLYQCQDWFVKFDTLQQAFEAHARAVVYGHPYAKAWQNYISYHSVEGLIRGIAPVYATAPGYADLLLKLVNSDRIKDALNKARA